MCLIVLGWRVHPEFPLIVAANRDEFHARPAAPAAFWHDQPAILAGRDLEATGTWMGVIAQRQVLPPSPTTAEHANRGAAESRGALVTEFLANGSKPGDYIDRCQSHAATAASTCWRAMATNCGGCPTAAATPRRLEPGSTAWAICCSMRRRLTASSKRFAAELSPAPAVESLFSLVEKAKIVHPQYGTRCSTVLLVRQAHVATPSVRFAPDGAAGETLHYEF